MEGDVYEVPLSIKMKREKTYREKQLPVIVALICALLNSDGGELNIEFEDDAILGDATDGILRMIEQRLIVIIGSCIFSTKVTMRKRDVSSKQLVFTVNSSQSLCTMDYKLYLPTDRQVIPISPSEPPERVKTILNREVRNWYQFENYEGFVLNREVQFKESDSIQFKHLKSEKSKRVSLADRITNKSNKHERYISAFANKDGGRIFYGINDDGVVIGEAIEEKDQEEIFRKVTKTINQLIWPGGKLERGRHWDIQFAPVKDENQNEIPSLFVVLISVVPLRGGLFTQEPESYHVVQGRVERMPFAAWSRRFFDDVMETVPSSVRRLKWSSVTTQRIIHKVLQLLLKYQNDGDHYGFEKFAALAQERYGVTERYQVAEVQLTILGEKSAHAYKSGQFKKAKSLIAEYQWYLSQQCTKDFLVFMLRAVYAKSAISRAKGNYQESYAIAKEGLQLAEMVPAGIITAWFYNHVAIVEKLLSQQMEEAERVSLVQSTLDHHIKALQHTKASTVEQEFSITVADTQQRTHIFRAITILGDIVTGANFRKAIPSDIKAAETDLSACDHLILEGYKETKYRKIYHLISLSDLRVCRWWQQQTKEKRSSEDYETPYLLNEAFYYATEAKELSIKCQFEQLTNYARNRLAVIIEIMIKHKVSSIRLPRNRVNDDK